MDSSNLEDIESDFTTQTITPGNAESFNENIFINGEFRQFGEGVPILFRGSSATNHHFLVCYARTDDNHLIEFDRVTEARNITFDLHGEATTLTKYLVIDNVNPAGTITISGLQIRDMQPFPTVCMIDTTGTTQTVVMQGARLDFNDPQNTIPLVGSTAGAASKVLIEGDIFWLSSKNLDKYPTKSFLTQC